jgi:hypothetical protein
MDTLYDDATPKEIFDMQRVWMLQSLYGTIVTNLFKGASDWYAPVRRLDLTHERLDLSKITFIALVNDSEQDATAETVWG